MLACVVLVCCVVFWGRGEASRASGEDGNLQVKEIKPPVTEKEPSQPSILRLFRGRWAAAKPGCSSFNDLAPKIFTYRLFEENKWKKIKYSMPGAPA